MKNSSRLGVAREEDELASLRAEIARLTKERDARPDISREDAANRIRDHHANTRVISALDSHAKGVK